MAANFIQIMQSLNDMYATVKAAIAVVSPGVVVPMARIDDANIADMAWCYYDPTSVDTPAINTSGVMYTYSTDGTNVPSAANWVFQLAYDTKGSNFHRQNINNVGWTAWVGGSGSGSGQGSINGVFYESLTTLTKDYTISAGNNSMCAGPLTIADGVIVTIPDGSVLTIL